VTLRTAWLVSLALLLFAPSSARAGEGSGLWKVAAPGPCAELKSTAGCPGGRCKAASTPARSRFVAADVAANPEMPAQSPEGLEVLGFEGPGSCADPGTPCGGTSPTEVAGGGAGGIPLPPAPPPPTPPVEPPPGVIEHPPVSEPPPGLP
jgi:hypothetical protein